MSILLLLAPAALLAHDLYLMPARFHVEPGETLTFALHNGDAFPGSEANVAVHRLRDAALGQTPATGLRIDGKRTLGQAKAASAGTLMLKVRTIPNLIELEPAQFHAYLKEEGLEEIITWRQQHGEAAKPGRERYSKGAKSLVVSGAPGDGFDQAAGFPLEIIPEQDPYRLAPGASLPVRVLFRGQPLAGVQLETAWAQGARHEVKPVGRTDAQGRLQVPLSQAGRWRLHALKMERCAEPAAADWESFWASLTFELK